MLRYLIITVISITTVFTADNVKLIIKNKSDPQLSYIGNWRLRGMFYNSGLTIKNDGTFRFTERGCIGSSYTEGNWSSDKTEIVLISYKKFQETDIDYFDKQIKILSIKVTKSTKGANWTYQPGSFVITQQYSSDPSDSLPIYFDKARLILKGDTLFMSTKQDSSSFRKYVRQ